MTDSISSSEVAEAFQKVKADVCEISTKVGGELSKPWLPWLAPLMMNRSECNSYTPLNTWKIAWLCTKAEVVWTATQEQR